MSSSEITIGGAVIRALPRTTYDFMLTPGGEGVYGMAIEHALARDDGIVAKTTGGTVAMLREAVVFSQGHGGGSRGVQAGCEPDIRSVTRSVWIGGHADES